MTEAAPIVIERQIRASAETIFAYFTDPDRYALWMGIEAKLDAIPGGIYEVHTPQGFTARGEFLEVDPPNRVVFSWGWEGRPDIPPGSTRVEVTLEPLAGTTLVTLVHTGLPVAEIAIHTTGWTRYLDRLVIAAAGGDPGPDEA